MGPNRMRMAAWISALCCGVLLNAPQTMAQLFGGMSMMDFETVRDSCFNAADVDHDLALSGEEQVSAMHCGPMAWVNDPALYECDDSDGDGICTYMEFLDSGQTVFSSLDRNGDGHLTPDEVQ